MQLMQSMEWYGRKKYINLPWIVKVEPVKSRLNYNPISSCCYNRGKAVNVGEHCMIRLSAGRKVVCDAEL